MRGVVTVGGFSGAFEELEASPREGGSILEDQPGEGMRKGVTVKGGISGIVPINYLLIFVLMPFFLFVKKLCFGVGACSHSRCV